MSEKARQYPLEIGSQSLLKLTRVDNTEGKSPQSGKTPSRRRANPIARAAGKYNREQTQASDNRHDGVYTTQNGAQVTIKRGQITDIVGEFAEGDQFTLQQSLAPGTPEKPAEKVENVAKAMKYGTFGKKKQEAPLHDRMIAVNMRVPGTEYKIHWIGQDALPNAFTITRENADRMANAFPQKFKRNR